MNIIIKNGTVISAGKLLKNTSVFINGHKITKRLLRPTRGGARNDEVIIIDARGAFVSPGLIDTHIHGSPGEIIANETRYGTTSFVIAVSCGRTVPDIRGYDNALGIRIEGPYINPKMAGAQDKRFIRPPSVKGLAKILKSGRGAIKMVTLAPELKGADELIMACLNRNVIPSIGHSDAGYYEAQGAFSSGIWHVTHIFNAISGPRHGTAGASVAALFDDRVVVEVIADMKHVSRGLLRYVFLLKSRNKIIFITDSVRAEVPRHPQGGRSHMIDCVRNAVKRCGASLTDAVRMASLNPAVVFGVARSKGAIAPGKDADIVVFDKNFDVKMTMIRGRIVYSKKGFVCAG